MVGDPIYLRPPDCRYCFRSDWYHPLVTGAIRQDRRLMLVMGLALEFDAAGHLLTVQESTATTSGSPLPTGERGEDGLSL
jgi:hypothetical protein